MGHQEKSEKRWPVLSVMGAEGVMGFGQGGGKVTHDFFFFFLTLQKVNICVVFQYQLETLLV